MGWGGKLDWMERGVGGHRHCGGVGWASALSGGKGTRLERKKGRGHQRRGGGGRGPKTQIANGEGRKPRSEGEARVISVARGGGANQKEIGGTRSEGE
ncbi:hypothetical protein TIFTF001_016806 [Ficus carica]|uniref:Uncharacterized protein n=1 Tax=Ficus carica TaxID=3494 RepID=A0AA88A8F2_FICCA|nr:hypothetical protein TIFTF001_016806 [Ficus carica]